MFPSLRDARIDHAWGGMMSYARHKMPQIGRLPDGLWYGLGFGGHGVAPTTAAGEVLAAAIAHGERDSGGLRAVWIAADVPAGGAGGRAGHLFVDAAQGSS